MMDDDEASAFEKFRHVIEAIANADDGDLMVVLTEGLLPEYIHWMMEILGTEICEQDPSRIESVADASKGVLIVFEKTEENPDAPEDHYTVVTSIDRETGDYILLDSYGFKRLEGGSSLDGSPVRITRSWTLPV